MYHKVDLESPTIWWVTVDSFYRQMLELRSRKCVYLDEYDPKNPDHVVITFDGVYKNIVSYAGPILRDFGYPFELFISSDYIGCSNEFDTVEPLAYFAGYEDLKTLLKMGGRLQWHTRSHPDLTTADVDRLHFELSIPEVARSLDEHGFRWFAYPHGRYNETVLSEVRLRFAGALACENGDHEDRHRLMRMTVTDDSRLSQNTIAVIIASYNYGEFLVEAVESVLGQTRLPDEILITDDASIDNTAEIAEYYQQKYPEIIRFNRNEKNLGTVEHFNKAVSLTTADFIVFLGADNRFRSDFIEKTTEVLDTCPTVAVAYTDFALFGRRAKIVYSQFPEHWQGQVKGDHFFIINFPDFDETSKASLKERNFIHGSSMYRRSAFEMAGGYVKVANTPEDYGLFHRMIIRDGWQAKRVPLPLLEYRQHSRDQTNVQLKSAADMQFYKDQFQYVRSQHQQLQEYYKQVTQQNSSLSQQQEQLTLSLNTVQSELEETRERLHLAQNEFQQLQQQLHLTQAEFQKAQAQLHLAQMELQQSQVQLHLSQTELQKMEEKCHLAQTELQQTQVGLLQAKELIQLMESSKFWKLRNLWFSIRKNTGF
jgi:hypothetical protein